MTPEEYEDLKAEVLSALADFFTSKQDILGLDKNVLTAVHVETTSWTLKAYKVPKTHPSGRDVVRFDVSIVEGGEP
jgi:hypothetical protein